MLRKIGMVGAAAMALAATQLTAEPLSIERAFSGPSLAGEDARGVQMSPDGRFVSFLKPATDDQSASVLWIMPVAGGSARALVDSRRMLAASATETEARMKYLERRYATSADALGYRWSTDGSRVLATVAGDLFTVDVGSGKILRLTQTDDDELDAKLAPGNANVSYVRGRNLYLRSAKGGGEWAVGTDAGPTIAYGQAEFVAQEEIRRFTGQWWSPDGSRIAYTRFDESAVKMIPRVKIDANATSVVDDRYPATGSPNVRIQLFVRGVDRNAPPIEVDLGPQRDIYLTQVDWSRDGRTLYAQRQTRDQKRLDLLAIDPVTGKSHVVVSEQRPTYVDLEHDFRPLADGTFLWGSTRTGWRHLYLYKPDGRLIRPVTRGAWRIANVGVIAAEDYTSIIGVDEAKGLVYFIASIDTPTERQLYSISYRKADTPHAITTGHGWWTPHMVGDRPAAFVGGYSDTTTPPNTALYDLSGRRIAWIAENRLDASHPYARFLDQRPSYEYGTFKAADGELLNYALIRPAAFDPRRRYPVIIRPYGGPNVQTVVREWRGPTDQLLTQAGYVVFQLDNRGSINRSEAFEHAVYGNLGGANMADQLAGIRFVKTLPFVDGNRVGMMGWSFGGYTTVRMLTEPGSGLAAGAAGGVPSDFALYDTHYTERFIGTPQGNPDSYRAGALLPRAKNLTGSLLLLHGLSDDNVVVPNFTALTTELQRNGKLFETVVYPGMAHVPRGADKQSHMWRTYLDFFARRMPAVDK